MTDRSPATVLAACLCFACLVASVPVPARAQAPDSAPFVDRVEPPNWWVGAAVRPVRLLLHGRDLTGAQVRADAGLTAGTPRTSAAGTYLFVTVKIAPNAPIGQHRLRIATPGGVTTASFTVGTPLPAAGRFQGFSEDDVVYLIMPDRFSDGDPSNDDPAASPGLYGRSNPHLYHGGDFQGVIDHLPYLKDLGITAIWINPVYDNYNGHYPGGTSADYHGYGAVDQYGVEEHFGTMATLKALVDHAHALGIKVIQDQVANHVGQMHPWTLDSPTPTWFNGTVAAHRENTYQIWTVMDPHALPAERDSTLHGWFANFLPDLNQDDPEVARYEIQNTLWWIGMTGFDGIREDTMPYVPRTFWRQWSQAVKRQYPRINTVGEVFDGDPAIVSYFQGGRSQADGVDPGITSLFDYPSYFPLRRAFANGGSFHDLVDDEAHDWMFAAPSQLMTFLGNHDVGRFLSEPGATVAGLEMAQTFLLTNRGIPLLYYGDEIGMTGGGDPDNRHDFPGGFPGDPRNAFTAAGRSSQQQEIWEHVRRLTHLRATLPALRRGTQTTLYLADKQWVYARTLNGRSVIVAFNNDTQPVTISVPLASLGLADGARLTDRSGTLTPVSVARGVATMTLPATSSAVLTRSF